MWGVELPGQGYDTVILGECGHWGDGAEGGENAVEAVREDAALDAGVEEGARDVKVGDVACCCDVAYVGMVFS